MQHINLSSYIDNDYVDNQLITGSTLVGYFNPSKAKPRVIILPWAVILQSYWADTVGSPDSLFLTS